MKSLEALKDAKCIHYLTPYLRDALEAVRLMGAEDVLCQSFVLVLERMLNNAYVQSAGHDCIEQWEAVLNLEASALSLQERRAEVIAKLSTQNVINEAYVMARIATLFGATPYTASMDCQSLKLTVTARNLEGHGAEELEPFVSVANAIRQIIPCNVLLEAQSNADVNAGFYLGVGSTASLHTKVTIGE